MTGLIALPVWTTDDALSLIRKIHVPLLELGFGIGLTGSLIYRGESIKDADIIIYPLRKGTGSFSDVSKWLLAHGWTCKLDGAGVRNRWAEDKSSNDTKHVEVWMEPSGRRVDLMILS